MKLLDNVRAMLCTRRCQSPTLPHASGVVRAGSRFGEGAPEAWHPPESNATLPSD